MKELSNFFTGELRGYEKNREMALRSFEKRVGANSAERTVRKLPTKVLLAAAVR